MNDIRRIIPCLLLLLLLGACTAELPGGGAEAGGDGLTLSPCLCLQTRIGPGCVHKGDNGTVEPFRLFHDPLGFPVALGSGHSEMAGQVLFQVFPFPMAQHCNGAVVEESHAPQNGGVVGTEPVSPLFL